ncbi:type IV pili twitching motility protein PilT [Candidatus Roizmanbacteria bacterium CG10_big_fil_rev_8_21_14_0_10_39_6]|uniref:Type IV pili twitching motility protein PilT n=1 Tax=Candidatus Roizmanbacteria bacterium CG10_big_fil_rev_8_21_14_0_10_39_6 TaxID=1974853 RepID=A0A2M8KTJ7_9BACT|nr:MAG: type IV pili twitching motility protein PilT [Candidatus Roizmanbacteria bacterium CG10_big_fil_rev_8_21_14_0_10_39_6]
MDSNLNKLLHEVIQRSASDLHINVGYKPTLRINGDLYQLIDYNVLSSDTVSQLFLSFTTKEQQEFFFLNKELDFSIDYKEQRFRANAYYERNAIALSLRLIPKKIPTIEQLGLPSILHDFTSLRQGLILITGQTGEGKSTTLASMLNEINENSASNILTIEDPIEFTYPRSRSIVAQRELKRDTLSFHNALRAILREDPDVVVLGEMRDYETIASAMTLAETGHLVFSTLHTSNASQTIDRIVDVFPEEQQMQIKTQLSAVLKVIFSQRLIPHASERKRIPACEILINNSAISSLIREGKTHQIDNVMQTGAQEGMVLFESHLKDLVLAKSITYETAIKYAYRPHLIKELLK